MTSPALKCYRVFVREWIVWDCVVEAASAKDAECIAQELWDTDGHEAFYLFNHGSDGATVGETVDGGG